MNKISRMLFNNQLQNVKKVSRNNQLMNLKEKNKINFRKLFVEVYILIT